MAPSNCRHRHPQWSSVASPSSSFTPSSSFSTSFSSSPWLSRRPFLDHLFAVFFSLNSIDLERLRQFPLFIAKANGSFTNTAPNHLDELSTKLNENTTTQTIKPNLGEKRAEQKSDNRYVLARTCIHYHTFNCNFVLLYYFITTLSSSDRCTFLFQTLISILVKNGN